MQATAPATAKNETARPAATNPRPGFLFRLLPSLTDVAFLMPIVFLFARMQGATSMLGDGDTGWHVRTGEWILANGRVPRQDMFSYTKAGQPWYAWEWLWDVCFAWLYHHGGLATVVSASILILCVTFALLYRLVRRHCENPFLAMGATFLACAGSTLHWLARPHLLTLLLVVVLLMMLERVEQGKPRWLIAVPLLMVLWTNLHGGFFAALIILGGFAAGHAAGALFTAEPEERRTAIRKVKWYAVTGFAAAAATLINPYTYHLHLHIYQFFSEPYHLENINEFQSISFHSLMAAYLECSLLLGTLSAIWFVVKRRNFVPLVLLVGWAHLALFSARNIPLFIIIAAPFVAEAVEQTLGSLERARVSAWVGRWLSAFRTVGQEFGETDRPWRIHAISAAAIAIIALLIASPAATGKLKPEYDPKRYPAQALKVLRADPNSRIFTDDEWGDYLVYNLYPGHKVFVDGRSDFYGQDFEQKYLDLMNVKYDWEQYLEKYKVDTIVLSTTTALASTVKESPNWRVVYDDTVAIVFRREPLSEHQQFSTAVRGKKSDPRISTVERPATRIIPVKRTKGV
ncbi:MAG TPA: hypothetical protein VEV17_15830 [Bryobacteraceae bacterium]|nr:hypothetical protein [Bryobacteraceae bacterium]